MGESRCGTNFGSEVKRKSAPFNWFRLRDSNMSGYYSNIFGIHLGNHTYKKKKRRILSPAIIDYFYSSEINF